MNRIRVVIAAAGRGSRAGLPYPKTLFPIQGKPILIRLLKLFSEYDEKPTIVVSPEGKSLIKASVDAAKLEAILVTQPSPLGMGDAVLRISEFPTTEEEDVLLVWGDIPFIQISTVEALVKRHRQHANDFTLISSEVESAYTRLLRDQHGAVISVEETRENQAISSCAGERDIGLFMFKRALVLDILREELTGRYGKTTKEHGFLYIIKHLVERGHKVEALPIAKPLDLVSLNSLDDVRGFL